MYGNNPVRKKNPRSDGALHVQEVFSTIQGEGPHAGRPAIFVRLAGCNLRCYFCDTDFESNWNQVLSPAQLVERIQQLREGRAIDLLVLTGGEPLLQDLTYFLDEVFELNLEVQIETSGSLWNESLDEFVWENDLEFVVSPKTKTVHPNICKRASAWKYIVRHGELAADGLPSISTQIPGKPSMLARPPNFHLGWYRDRIYLQPCDEGDELKNTMNLKAAIDSCMTHGYRLCLQQHKLVGLP
ncbi:MAG: 7-carboxy-7-deazaguanine synthase QueE [candidate division WOR-3 bacterium]